MDKPIIFVVDDDPTVRDSVVALIRHRGYETRAFTSAEDFLKAQVTQPPGCMVLDVRMPGMSGLELLSHLRSRGSQFPVIVVTAHGDVPTAVKAMKAGAETFLEKPFSQEDLWQAIEEILGRASRHQEQGRLAAEFKERMTKLSPDEMQVYKLLVDGYQNKQVASKLSIGLRTVELRRSTIMKKMQAGSFSELVRMAILGELESSGDPPADNP